MKKLIVLSSVCAMLAIGCGKKIMPESDADNPSKPTRNKTDKETTNTNTGNNNNNNNTSSSTPSFNNMQRSAPTLPDGPRSTSLDKGKTVYVAKCGSCHALKNPGDYTSDQINAFLNTEIARAKLDNKEAEQVTAYLFANAKK